MADIFSIHRYAKQRDKFKDLIEDFRKETFEEGSDLLSYENFDPDYADIEVWMVMYENKIIAISAVESSQTTGDAHIAARLCKYYKLKSWESINCISMMLDGQIGWAKNDGFQVLYHTGKDIDPRLTKQKDFVYKDPKTGKTQNIYSINVSDEKFTWKPKENVIWT